jgi:hypothetical protein
MDSEDPCALDARVLRRGAWLGAVVWGLLWTLEIEAVSGAPIIERLVALGPLVAAPLGLSFSAPRRWLRRFWAPAAAGVPLSLLMPAGDGALVVALPWLVFTLACAGLGVRRLLTRGPRPVEEAALDAGLIYLAVGGIWLTASRAGVALLGFDLAIVTLTAAHFHFAGFSAATVCGGAGRLLAPAPRAWRVAAAVVSGGPILVALGITFSPLLEVVTALALAAGVLVVGWGIARRLCPRLWREGRGLEATLLAPGAAVLVGTMALAAIYAVQEFVHASWVVIPTMARLHGVGNALGFAVPSLLALAWLEPRARWRVPEVPAPGWSGGADIGPAWFEDRGLVGEGAAQGLVVSMRDLDRPGHFFGDLPPEIAAFYEDTMSLVLVVRPRWQPPFVGAGRLYRRTAAAVGQLVLPVADREQVVVSRLAPLTDGRVASVRTYEDGGAMYVAAYSVDRLDGRPYMRVVLPLPGGALTSIMRADRTPEGLRLSCIPDPADPGAEGTWLTFAGISLWTPVTEVLDARAEGGQMRARHTLAVAGRPFVILDYRLEPAPPRDQQPSSISSSQS